MKKLAQNLALVMGATLVSLLLAEAALRLVGYSSPRFLTIDPELGVFHLPGAEGRYQKEGDAYVRINSAGLRDVEHALAKPAETLRIAVLGDSYAEGLQVELEALFWKILEQHLQRCAEYSEKTIEAINFGVSGYGTAQELLMLRSKVWAYDPDIVVLAFLTGNDVRDNSKELQGIDYMPYFTLGKDGELVLDRSFLSSAGYRSRQGMLATIMYTYGNKLRLLQLIRDFKTNWLQSERKAGTAADSEVGLDDQVYVAPITQSWQDAWSVTEALIRQMKKEVENNGARFLLVTLSNAIQVDPDRKKRAAFAERLGVDSLYYPDMRIRSYAQQHKIDILTLAPVLAKAVDADNIYLHGFENTTMGSGHWNANGHRLAGELMARFFCTLAEDKPVE